MSIEPAPPQVSERYVEVEGRRTRYLEAGAGPPLLLLPSVFLRASTYRGAIERLAADFRVLAAEMPGSGDSARLARAWDFPDAADWAAGFLDALGIGRATVLGHSHSGGVGVVMGARHPARLDALVLVNSVGARPEATWPALLAGLMLDGLTREPLLGPSLAPDVARTFLRHPRNILYNALCLTASDLPLKLAPGVAAPTLLAWGRRDRIVPPACAERLADALPESRIRWVDDSHDWAIRQPVVLADAVSAFAAEVGIAGRPAPRASTGPVGTPS